MSSRARLSDPVPYDFAIPPSPPSLHPRPPHHSKPGPPSQPSGTHRHHQGVPGMDAYGRSPKSLVDSYPGNRRSDATVDTAAGATGIPSSSRGYRLPHPNQLHTASTRAWTARRSPLAPASSSAMASFDEQQLQPDRSHPSTAPSSVASSLSNIDDSSLGESSSHLSEAGQASGSTGSGGTDGWRIRAGPWSPFPQPDGTGISPEDVKRSRQHSGDSNGSTNSSGGGWGAPGTDGNVGGGAAKRQRFGEPAGVGAGIGSTTTAAGPASSGRRPSMSSTATATVGSNGRYRQPSISINTNVGGPAQNPTLGGGGPPSSIVQTPGAPPLAGSFTTPNRTTLLRRDSLQRASPRSAAAGGPASRIRMDGGAMKMLGYPRAPTQRKLDTPVGEYDGTPLGVGLGGGDILRETAGGFGAGIGGVGRKASLNRLLMDDQLAKDLEMGGKLPASRDSIIGLASAASTNTCGGWATPAAAAWACQGMGVGATGLRRKPSHLANTVSPPEEDDDSKGLSSSLHDVAMEDAMDIDAVSTSKPVSSNRTGPLQGAPTWHAQPRPAGRERTMEMDVVSKAAEVAELQRRQVEDLERRPSATDPNVNLASAAATRPGSQGKDVVATAAFVPTPSNRRMGFSVEEAKEVVPSDAPRDGVAGTDNLLSICVLAVESIWPDNRPANWTYERSLSGGHRLPGPTNQQGVLPLSTFVKEVLRRSRTTPHTLHVALFYLHQSRRAIRDKVALGDKAKAQYFEEMQRRDSGSDIDVDAESSPGQRPDMELIVAAMSDPVLCGRRMFLAALMCASKYLQDRNFSNRAWAKISGLPVKEVNSNERVFLALVQYKLHVEVDVFERWIARLQKLSEDKGRSETSSGASTAVPPSGASTAATARWGSSESTAPAQFASAAAPLARSSEPTSKSAGQRPMDRLPIQVPLQSAPTQRTGPARSAPRVEPPSISRPSLPLNQPVTSLRSGRTIPSAHSATLNLDGPARTTRRRPSDAARIREEAAAMGGTRRHPLVYEPPTMSRDLGASRDRFVSAGDFRHRQTYGAGVGIDEDVDMEASSGSGSAWGERPPSASSCGMQDSGRNTPIGGPWSGPSTVY